MSALLPDAWHRAVPSISAVSPCHATEHRAGCRWDGRNHPAVWLCCWLGVRDGKQPQDKGCCRSGALRQSCGVLIGVAGMWSTEKCARNSNTVHASFAWALCMDSHVTCQTALLCAHAGCQGSVRCFPVDPAALTWQLLNQCSSWLLDQWLTCNRGNNIMLLAGRVGCQHVSSGSVKGHLSTAACIPDFSLLLLHISRRKCLSQSTLLREAGGGLLSPRNAVLCRKRAHLRIL